MGIFETFISCIILSKNRHMSCSLCVHTYLIHMIPVQKTKPHFALKLTLKVCTRDNSLSKICCITGSCTWYDSSHTLSKMIQNHTNYICCKTRLALDEWTSYPAKYAASQALALVTTSHIVCAKWFEIKITDSCS